MRITGGAYKNRKLFVPDGRDIRPTSDRMRQTLFNMVHHAKWASDFDLIGAHVLDLYCGSGALGLEALSHGASHCTFMDADISTVRKNAAFLNDGQAMFIKANLPDHVSRLPQSKSYDLIFLDPPYRLNLAQKTVDLLMKSNLLNDNSIVVVEVEKGAKIESDLELLDCRTQSQSDLYFFKNL